MNESMILHSVTAAKELHKVPGFDPTKYLRKTVNSKGEPVMRLEPRYQRLWFRLACPKGRMLLNPLRLTDQLAIFEAKVFFHREDDTPASSFTSTKRAQETRDYVRAAQDEALTTALDNAGFGIQLCDVTQTSGDGEYRPSAQASGGQEAPVQAHSQMEPAAVQDTPPASPAPVREENQTHGQTEPQPEPPVQTTEPSAAEKLAPVSAPVTQDAPAPAPTPVIQDAPAPVSAPVAQDAPAPASVPADQPAAPARTMEPSAPVAEDVPAPAPQADVQKTVPVPAAEPDMRNTAQRAEAASNGSQHSELAAMLNFPGMTAETAVPQETGDGGTADTTADPHTAIGVEATPAAPADTAPAQVETPAQAAPSYTDDMSVEEICQVMTLEEAGAIVVPSGPNMGLTMAQVAERRPSSLRFFMTQFYKCSNSQKAAATLLIQNLDLKKAG